MSCTNSICACVCSNGYALTLWESGRLAYIIFIVVKILETISLIHQKHWIDERVLLLMKRLKHQTSYSYQWKTVLIFEPKQKVVTPLLQSWLNIVFNFNIEMCFRFFLLNRVVLRISLHAQLCCWKLLLESIQIFHFYENTSKMFE